MKRCPRCATDKPLDAFGVHRGQPLGRAIWCKECARAADRARRLRPEVREAQRLAAQKRRRDPAVKIRTKITDAEWVARNPDKRRAYDRSEKKRAAGRAYITSPDGRLVRRVAEQKRRAAKACTEATLTRAEWLAIVERFQGLCAYCLAPSDRLEIEHVQPLVQGGAHSKENVVPACPSCNRSKNRRDLVQFLAFATVA